jgi:hypothetical protein
MRIRYQLSLFSCPACASGEFNALHLTRHGKEIKRGRMMSFPIHPENCQAIDAV